MINYRRFLALLLPAMLAVSSPSPTLHWSQGPRLPFPRTEVQVAQSGSRLYVLGGYSAQTDFESRVDIFDATSGLWSAGPPLPVGRNHTAVAAGNGYIYVFGGCCSRRTYSADVLDIAANAWRALPPMPAHCGAGAAAVLDGKVHIASGNCDVAPDTYRDVTTHLVYDPMTERYSTAAPLPEARNHLCLIAAAGRLFAIGGRHETKAHERARVDIYDPRSDRWTPGAPLPAKRSGAACALSGGYIFVIGGDAGTEQIPAPAHDTVFVYSIARNRWSNGGTLPHGLHGTDAAVLGGTIYLPGGSAIGGHKRPLDEMLEITPEPAAATGSANFR